LCPIACENFIKLCVSTEAQKQYLNCPIHRIVKNGFFQSGDIIDGSGRNSLAIINDSGFVQDESFSVDFGFRLGGVVGYANSGPHSNGSQFFVTLGPSEWMNNNFIGIGRVIQGFSVLKEINNVTCSNQVPSKNIVILSAGYVKDKKY
jgi:cyclophilin family peptidyl-prolyl cis-trans isomerase